MIKFILFTSSFIPLFIMLFIKELGSNNYKSSIEVLCSNIIFWVILIAISILSLLVLLGWLYGNNNVHDKKFKGVTTLDNEILSYFITYIIPLLSLEVDNIYSIINNLFLFALIGVIQIKNNNLYNNVILIILGYSVFKDEKNMIIISKKKLGYIENQNIDCHQIGASKYFIIK
ncbi:hypothetical protein KRP69_14420 [Mammaliicoccus sciuri]|uniref:hypothetical protein n=1 Tax=Staphylococcus equorum TaxID=246432 RepID=UPI00114C917C|nr:hypothetical protein [Staphylococcus equorum]MCC2090366.1 hypothetical protein [Mammaliicoccus sciuri]